MTAKKTEKTGSLEQSLKRLEQIVHTLEGGSVSLDDAMDLYEEGIGISKDCADRLKAAELRVKKLTKDIDGRLTTTEFEEEE